MNKIETSEDEKTFLSDPNIVENYGLLQKIGVFKYIDSLHREIRNYKDLFSGALDIFNRTTIGEIMDVAVWRISDHFLPAFVVFLWKPLANKEEVLYKGYKNYMMIDLNLKINSITEFEVFFRKHPRPVSYDRLKEKLEAALLFETLDPELIIPIMGPSGLYGMVLVGRKVLEDEYNAAELLYLQELMSFVSQAIQNHLHYDRTLRDVKTGLFNNGFFMTRLNEEIARSRRTNTTFSIIIIDVDKFKSFNDTFGHLAGDKVLECLAMAIKQGLRTEDVPSRFGGEEFTILIPDSDKNAAWIVAERLRNSVATMRIPWDPPLPQVTISLGVCIFNRETNITGADLIHRADEALYLSKERGRNRTTVWGSGLLGKIELLSLGKKKIEVDLIPKTIDLR